MKVEKIIDRDYTKAEQDNIDYLIKYFGKMNMAFVGEHCGVVLNKSNKEEMVDNAMEIIEEIKKGPKIVTAHVLEDGYGMVIMGGGKWFIHAVSTAELSEKEIAEDQMNDESEKMLTSYCEEALKNPEVIALGIRHDFITFMESKMLENQ